jgi:hypothetical protein
MSQAMRAFYEEMVVQGLADKVTHVYDVRFCADLESGGHGRGGRLRPRVGRITFRRRRRVTASDFYGINTSNGTPFPTLNGKRTGRRRQRRKRPRTLDSDGFGRTIRRDFSALVRLARSESD